jgi:hypothetical protein
MSSGDTSQLSRRVAQMVDLGIFRDVLAELRQEIARAIRLLDPWDAIAPCHRLRDLAGILEHQAMSLKTRD